MSLQRGGSAGIALVAPVSTAAQAARAAAAGARLVEVGRDSGALIPAIRRAAGGVRICGHHESADVVWEAALAARTGAGLICPDQDAAAAAVRRGIPAGRIWVQTTPAGVGPAVRAGWTVLADLEEQADLEDQPDSLARTEAIAALCAWLGASVLRTRHVAQVRRCADMTESIAGRRPPAWALRGLA